MPRSIGLQRIAEEPDSPSGRRQPGAAPSPEQLGGALAQVMRDGRDYNHPLVMGAVKANFGHTEMAAGALGVMKATLALQHEQAPPNPELKSLNPSRAAFTHQAGTEALPIFFLCRDVPTLLADKEAELKQREEEELEEFDAAAAQQSRRK